MIRDYVTLLNDSTIGEAAINFIEKDLKQAVVINSEGKPEGVVYNENFLFALINKINPECCISEILSNEFVTTEEDKQLDELLWSPTETTLVLGSDGKVTGLMTRALLKSLKGEIHQVYSPCLNTIFDAIPSGLIVVNSIGMVVLCNTFAAKVLGVSAENAMGKHFKDIYDDDLLLKVLKTGKEEISDSIKDLNGENLAFSSLPILINGSVTGAIGLFQNVSDKEALAKELLTVKDLNEELNEIIESSYDGFVVTDSDGKVLRINKSYSRISGVPWEVLSKNIGTYCGSLEKSQDMYTRGSKKDSLLVLINQGPTTITQRLWNTNEVKFTGNPVYSVDGEIHRVVWNIRDITQLNNLKRQIEENKYQNNRFQTELSELRARLLNTEGLIFQSPEMKNIVEMAVRVASVDATVLITGETGVGKDVVAKIIHNASSRKNEAFIPVNCGAIPENLLESELFGYENGAFTGAKREGKIGLFEAANNGTIFLDEIGDLPMAFQVKLLRVLQNHEIVKVGSNKSKKLNLRIIGATNKNLSQMVKDCVFREDLFYRLNVIPIHIPALRKRKADIIPLASNFLDILGKKYCIKKELSQEVSIIFKNYSWPGNVRELENVIERALVIGDDVEILPRHVLNYLDNGNIPNYSPITVSDLLPLKDAREILERELLSQAMKSGFSTRKVASILKVDHSTIVRKINKYKDRDKVI